MKNQEFLYRNTKFEESKRAIVVLPEVYGITGFVKDTVDRFANEFEMLSFGLDFFYQLTMKPNKLDYIEGREEAMNLMNQMTGEDFVNIFDKALSLILEEYPHIQEVVICGFCFGGRLAFLSGINPKINKIVSFYGAGANKPFYKDKSVIGNLCLERKNSKDLKVLGFFGTQDPIISKDDSNATKNSLTEAGVNYVDYNFETGHAFFNHERETYNKLAAEESWRIIHTFINLPVVV